MLIFFQWVQTLPAREHLKGNVNLEHTVQMELNIYAGEDIMALNLEWYLFVGVFVLNKIAFRLHRNALVSAPVATIVPKEAFRLKK